MWSRVLWERMRWEWMRWDRAAVRLGLGGSGIGWRCGIEWGCGSGSGWPGQCGTWRCRTPGCRTPVPPSRGALSRGVPSRGAAEPRGTEPRGVEPRSAEPGSAEARITEPQGLRTRGRRNQGAEPRGTEPTTPWPAPARAALSCPNPGDTELVSAERRRCRTRRGRTSRGGPSLRADGPGGAGRVVVGTSRFAAAEAQPRPERGPVRSTGTRLRVRVFHVEHRADGRVPTGAPPTARDAQPSPPRCRLCVTSVTARTRLRPTRPVLGRRPSGAEPVVVRI